MANKLFFESFDHPYWSYDKLWAGINAPTYQVSGTYGRNGSGLYFNSTVGCQYLAKGFGEVVPHMVLGFAYRMPSSASAGFATRQWETVCQLQSEDYANKFTLSLVALPGSGQSFYLGARLYDNVSGVANLTWITRLVDGLPQPVIANSLTSFVMDTWYYIEVDALFGAVDGGHIKVYVDGSAVINEEDITTTNADVAGTGWAQWLIGGYGNGNGTTTPTAWCTGFFDDLYCHYGDSPTRLGDITVSHAALTGLGTSQDWAATGGDADDVLNDNDPATYIASSTTDEISTFDFTDLGVTPQTIHGVQVAALGLKTQSGSRSVALTITNRSYQNTLTASTDVPADNDTVTIGTAGAEEVYTFKTALSVGPAVPFEVLIGATKEDTLDNLAAAIMGADGEGTLYATGTTAHTKIYSAVRASAVLTVTGIPGEDLSTQATTKSCANLAWAHATLTLVDDADVGSDLPMSANTKNFIHTFTVDPRTNTEFDVDWLNNAQIGVKCR